MMPYWLKIKIPRSEREPFNLYFPMLIVWIILTLIMVLVLPFMLLFYLIFWFKWYGKLAILFFPMLFSLLCQLKGLQVDVQDSENHIYFSFI